MKNKEIEELLKNFQEVLDNPTTTDECYDGRIIEIDRSYDLEQDEIKLLLSYIEQLEKENQQLKEKLNCKEYFSSTMPEGTEFVILTKNNYDKQQKDLTLENIQLKKQKDDVVEYIKKHKHINWYVESCYTDDLLRMLGEIE